MYPTHLLQHTATNFVTALGGSFGRRIHLLPHAYLTCVKLAQFAHVSFGFDHIYLGFDHRSSEDNLLTKASLSVDVGWRSQADLARSAAHD